MPINAFQSPVSSAWTTGRPVRMETLTQYRAACLLVWMWILLLL